MLALVAGQGRLPEIVAGAVGGPRLVAALECDPPERLVPDLTFRIERLGSFLDELRARGVTEVCFAGAIRRPALEPAAVDAATAPLVPRMLAALGAGDDAALRIVLELFEEAGFAVRAAHELVPELLPAPGVATERRPGPGDEADAARGAEIVAALGAADLGQACVVHRGQALALEAAPGTAFMLASLAPRPDGATGGLLYKAPKPAQDRRIDLPAIGPDTVTAAAAADLGGIVLEAGGVMVLDRDEVLARAGAAGLFLWVREP